MLHAVKSWQLAGLALLVPASLVAAVLLGVADIPSAQALAVLLRGDAPQTAMLIVVDIRLPRVLAGALAGVHFALSGLVLQRITHNPLADPSLLGISQGATLAVTLFLLAGTTREALAGHSLAALPVAWMPLAGTLGGMAGGATIYLIALRHGLGPLRVTLCGIAVGAVLQALAQEARVLLLDEPTTFLDIGYQVEVLELVQRLSRERGVAVVMAIHDLNQALSVCDRVSLLEAGTLVFDGEPAALVDSGGIERVFRVKGRFVELAPGAAPHFDVEIARRPLSGL